MATQAVLQRLQTPTPPEEHSRRPLVFRLRRPGCTTFGIGVIPNPNSSAAVGNVGFSPQSSPGTATVPGFTEIAAPGAHPSFTIGIMAAHRNAPPFFNASGPSTTAPPAEAASMTSEAPAVPASPPPPPPPASSAAWRPSTASQEYGVGHGALPPWASPPRTDQPAEAGGRRKPANGGQTEATGQEEKGRRGRQRCRKEDVVVALQWAIRRTPAVGHQVGTGGSSRGGGGGLGLSTLTAPPPGLYTGHPRLGWCQTRGHGAVYIKESVLG
jgi:hypothetical protein